MDASLKLRFELERARAVPDQDGMPPELWLVAAKLDKVGRMLSNQVDRGQPFGSRVVLDDVRWAFQSLDFLFRAGKPS